MSEVTLPTRPTAQPAHQAAGSSAPGTVSDPPTGALRLAPGSLLHGVVSGQGQQGQLLVQTDLGLLAVATKLALPVGREVSLQIRSAGSQLHITILPLENAPVAEGRLPPAQPRPLGEPAVIREPPPTAARLPAGALLSATVLDVDPDGGFLLRSELGQLRLVTSAPLKPGDQLSLQVRSLVPDLQVTVLPRQVGPGAAAGGPRAGPATAAGAAAPSLGHVGPTVDILAVGRPVQALVLARGPQPTSGHTPASPQAGKAAPPTLTAGATGTLPTATASRTLPAGTTLEVRIQQISPPAQAPSAAATAAAPSAPSSPTAPQQTLLATLAGLTPERLAAATDLAAVSRGQQAPAVLQGRVVGSAAGGQPILETPVGTLQLAVETALPQGTRLLLRLPPGLDLPETLARAKPPVAAAEAEPLGRHWPALESLLPILDEIELFQAGSQSGTQQAGPSVPQPGPKLASSLLFFLNALTGGDPGAWLDGLMGGRAAARLEALGQQGLLARLRGDLLRIAGQGEAAGPEWRFLPVPFFDGQSLHQLRFFFRHQGDPGERDGQGGESDKDATRFLLDVELQQLGALQFDGLIQTKRFDMILRSHRPLPDWMRGDIRTIFENANEATGASGQLRFHAADDWAPVAVAVTKPEPEGLVV